jgi:O-antigen/teichoic acid export membrane protein
MNCAIDMYLLNIRRSIAIFWQFDNVFGIVIDMRFIERVKYFVSHKFVRSTAVLQIGTIAGTLIQAIAGIFVARLLAPDMFGQYSIAFSVASIVTIFLGAGVQDAVAPNIARAWATADDNSLRQSLGFWAKFTLANIIATCVVVLAVPFITGHLYGSSVLGGYADLIIIASLVSTTLFTIVQLMLQISGRIGWLSCITLTDVAVRYSLSVCFLLVGFGIWGAVSGHLIGAIIIFAISMVLYQRLVGRYVQIPSIAQLIKLIRSTSWNPLIGPTVWVMIDRNLGMLYGALPVAMIGLYVAGAEVAYFKLAFGYLMLAMTALGPISTLLNVHFPTVQVTDRRRLRDVFVRVTLYSILMTTGITFVVLAISPLVFRVLYGNAYLPSIPYVYGLGLFGVLFGLGVGLGPMWRAVNRVHVSILINIITLGLGIPLGIALITHWHVWGAVAMVTIWYTLAHIISFLYLLNVLKSSR